MQVRDYIDITDPGARKVDRPGGPVKTSRQADGGPPVVAQAVVVQRADAIGEKPELPPVVEARTEGEVEEVLAVELDADQPAVAGESAVSTAKSFRSTRWVSIARRFRGEKVRSYRFATAQANQRRPPRGPCGSKVPSARAFHGKRP
jgi:hypothetical protein